LKKKKKGEKTLETCFSRVSFFLKNLENEFSPLHRKLVEETEERSRSLGFCLMNLKEQQLPKGTASHLFTHFSFSLSLVY
jgi:hypothetical protein